MPTDTRSRIVFAAMELFWEKGYSSTSVADLLKRADVNAGSLYHFFPGKQDVLIAVLETYREGIGPMLLEPAWRDIDDPIEKIFALLAHYRKHIVDTDCTYGCPIGSVALELHEPDPPVRELLAANFRAWIAAIHERLVQAGSRLPADIDRAELAEFVLTTMEGAVMQARTFRDVGNFDRSIAQLRAYFARLERDAAGASRPGRPRPKVASKSKSRRRR
jgi:AcrR family transcriptional regulator